MSNNAQDGAVAGTEIDPLVTTTVPYSFVVPTNDYERMASGATVIIARHLIEISPSITEASIVHDNAAGTGVLIHELLGQYFSDRTPPRIYATDASPTMVAHLEAVIGHNSSHYANVLASVMPAEQLDFPDGAFTHSFTNFGMMFFSNPEKAAREIYRTVQPGGFAFVTTWADLGYWDAWRAAEAKIRPDQEPFEWPIREDWTEPTTIDQVMTRAGFGEVSVHQQESCRREKDLRTLVENLSLSFGKAVSSWTEKERNKLVPVLMEEIANDEQHYFFDADKQEEGIKMLANVAVCRK